MHQVLWKDTRKLGDFLSASRSHRNDISGIRRLSVYWEGARKRRGHLKRYQVEQFDFQSVSGVRCPPATKDDRGTMDEIDEGGTAAQHHIITTAQKEVGSGSMCEYFGRQLIYSSTVEQRRRRSGFEHSRWSLPKFCVIPILKYPRTLRIFYTHIQTVK